MDSIYHLNLLETNIYYSTIILIMIILYYIRFMIFIGSPLYFNTDFYEYHSHDFYYGSYI